jgi:hypothetical protein
MTVAAAAMTMIATRAAGAQCMRCWSRVDQLSAREVDFMTTLNRWRSEITVKQRAWLESIHNRLRRAWRQRARGASAIIAVNTNVEGS